MVRYSRAIWACRYFWLSLVRMDLRARYRRSVLGLGWSLLRPVAFTAILCLVFRRLFPRGDVWEFAPYLLSGLTCWDYVTTATKQGCHCFFHGESYIRQHPAPVAIFPLRATLTETFHFLISLMVLLGLTFWIRGAVGTAALASLAPTLVLLFGLVWALALLAGFANVYFQDVQHICDIVFQVAFYVTPIFYEAKDLGGRLGWVVTHCNPLVPFLHLLREPVLHGRVPEAGAYALAALVVLLVGGLAAGVCRLQERRLIFQL